MAQIRHHAIAEGTKAEAFAIIDDYRTVPEWMFGLTEFRPLTELDRGLGATYASVMKIGPKSLKSTLEVIEHVPDEVICLKSTDGVDVTTRWAFSDGAEAGTVRVDVEFDYSLGGGLAGRALSAVVEPVVGQAVKQTERELTRRIQAQARR